MRVSEGIRTPDPWGHNPFGMTIPLGKSMVYRGVFLSHVGWRGVVWGRLQPLGTQLGTTSTAQLTGSERARHKADLLS
jgi:hypothetical protein